MDGIVRGKFDLVDGKRAMMELQFLPADYRFLLPEFILLLAVLWLLATASWRFTQSYAHVIAICSLFGALLVLWSMGTQGNHETTGALFQFDSLSFFARSIILLGSAFILFLPCENESILNRKNITVEHAVLIILASIGLMVMVCSYDFLTLYLGMELVALSLAVMVASRREKENSITGGLTYFVLSAVASLFFLYGVAMLYGFGGGTSFAQLAQLSIAFRSGEGIILILAAVFILSSLAFKMAAAPFHFWAPDVYQAAPTHVTVFLATIPKIVTFIVFMRLIMSPLQGFFEASHELITFFAISSMVLGSLAALVQSNLKRLLAYSSIAHIGFALVGLVAANEDGLKGALIYMIIYGVMALGTFALILIIQRRTGTIRRVDDLSGLAQSHPMVSLALAIMILSMAGLPPLAGFFAKVQVLFPVIQQGYIFLAMVVVFSTVVGCYYYLRLLKVMYFQPAHDDVTLWVNRETSVLIVLATIFVVFYGIAPALFLDTASLALAPYLSALP